MAYLRNPGEGEACLPLPMLRRSGDVLTRYWLEDCAVRSCFVSDAVPKTLPSAVRAQFGDPLPKLAAETARRPLERQRRQIRLFHKMLPQESALGRLPSLEGAAGHDYMNHQFGKHPC